MIIFIKKLKTKEGINSFDTEKIKKDIPAGYKASGHDPIVTLTAKHMLIAYKCDKTAQPVPEVKPKKEVAPKKASKPSPRPAAKKKKAAPAKKKVVAKA